MADGLVAMGFSPEQAEAAFAATGDVERALAILLEQAEEGAPAPAEDEAPLDVLADAKLELLVEMGYAPLVAAKALVLHRGDAERASAFLLEQPSPLDESLFVLTPEELGPALRGGETRGLRVQLEAICQAPGPFMRTSVGAALLDFLRSRAAGAEREESWRTTAAWACRVLNAVADGSQLLQLPTVELLLECLAPTQLGAGDSAAAERLSASGSLSDVLASMLRRIELESAEQRELRQACCGPVLTAMLQLVASFAAANPRSPLPAACQTALELARTLAQDDVVGNVWPSEEMVAALCTVLCHGDEGCHAAIGGLDILHGLVGAYSRGSSAAQGTAPELFALLTASSGGLLSALLSVVALPPAAAGTGSGAGIVFTETCALLCELVSANSVLSDLLCATAFGSSAPEPEPEPEPVGSRAFGEDCMLHYYSQGTEPQLARALYGSPGQESELLQSGVGILQAILSSLDEGVGSSAVADAAIALLSIVSSHFRRWNPPPLFSRNLLVRLRTCGGTGTARPRPSCTNASALTTRPERQPWTRQRSRNTMQSERSSRVARTAGRCRHACRHREPRCRLRALMR